MIWVSAGMRLAGLPQTRIQHEKDLGRPLAENVKSPSMRLNVMLFTLAAVFLSGCVSISLSPGEIASADFGRKPLDYEDRVKAYMGSRLKDPMSAVYDFNPNLKRVALVLPVDFERRRAMGKDGVAFANVYGWAVEVSINAKNSYGGYTGAKMYVIMFTAEGQTVEITSSLQVRRAAFVD